jgi:ubiquinone/menaquinone biosynthesis C-methylase UbiE
VMGCMKQEEVWDVIAEKWAGFRVQPTEEVVEFLDGKSGKILDLGCGSGRHCLVSKDLEFYGVDFSEKLLQFTKGKGYVEVKKEFSYDVPYDGDFFDFVVFSRVLHCIDSAEKRRKSLEEVYRVLKSGGEALVVTWGKKGCKRIGGKKEGFARWTIGKKITERYTYIYDVDELESELESVGFKVLKVEEGKNIVFVVGKS